MSPDLANWTKEEIHSLSQLQGQFSNLSVRKLIDEGFNRHANHDTNLPEWFADDERKYRGPAGYAMDLPEDLMEQARHRLTLTLALALALVLALALDLALTLNTTLTLTITNHSSCQR